MKFHKYMTKNDMNQFLTGMNMGFSLFSLSLGLYSLIAFFIYNGEIQSPLGFLHYLVSLGLILESAKAYSEMKRKPPVKIEKKNIIGHVVVTEISKDGEETQAVHHIQ